MIELIKTSVFDIWLRTLRDRQAKVRIAARIDRLASGNPGDVKPIGGGLSEMRINHGPGYRIYFMQRGSIYQGLMSVTHRTLVKPARRLSVPKCGCVRILALW